MTDGNDAQQLEDEGIDNDRIARLIDIDPWEEIGFHRPLGGFWFDLTIKIFSAIIGLLLISAIYKYLYPYPEMEGYNRVAAGFFAIIYNIFDMGTAFGIERFIAEYRVKDTKKMLEYVRFFVWYQMFTGLVQVAAISGFIFMYLRQYVKLSYLSWLFLIICQKQYPGMLGTFKSVLKGLQKYNKSKILDFIGGAVFQNLTNIIFILLGRWWGQNTPMIGDLMGGAIGFAIGAYIDDFFTMMVSARYLQQELALLGYSMKDAVSTKIGKDVKKQCLWFGFQASMVPILNIISETLILVMFLEYLPQYTTWVVLKSFAGGLSSSVNVGNFEISSSIAESYSSDKKELTQFYVSNSLKWNGFLMMFLVLILIGFLPVINQTVSTMEGLENYVPALIFIPFLLVEQLFFPYIQISDPILVGTLHVGFYTFVRLFEEIIRLGILYLLLIVLELPVVWGTLGIVLTLGYDRFYARLIKMVMALVYINRRVFKVKIYWMSTIVIPLISSIPGLIFIQIWRILLLNPLTAMIGFIPAAIITVVACIAVIPFFLFLPLVGYLGGFDDFQMETFRKAVELSGPSKWIVKGFYNAIEWGHERCPWKNKYKIPWEVPQRQIKELLKQKADVTPDL